MIWNARLLFSQSHGDMFRAPLGGRWWPSTTSSALKTRSGKPSRPQGRVAAGWRGLCRIAIAAILILMLNRCVRGPWAIFCAHDMRIQKHSFRNIYIYIPIYIYIYICMYIFIYVYIYIFIYWYIYVFTCSFFLPIHIYIFRFIYTYIFRFIYTYIFIFTYTHI